MPEAAGSMDRCLNATHGCFFPEKLPNTVAPNQSATTMTPFVRISDSLWVVPTKEAAAWWRRISVVKRGAVQGNGLVWQGGGDGEML
jgi:hypothetical protein